MMSEPHQPPPQQPRKRGRKPRPRPENDSRDHQVSIAADPSKGGSRGYDVHFRRRVLALADAVGECEAGRQYGVSRRTIYRWRNRVIPYKMTGGKKKKKKTGDPTTTATAAAPASPSTTSAVAKQVARRPASKQPRPMTRNDEDDDDEVELLEGPGEFSRDHDRSHLGGGGADGIAVAFAATTTTTASGGDRGSQGRAADGEVAVSANEGELLQGGATCTPQLPPAPSMTTGAAAVPPALRTQLEARLLEAAYVVRPLLSMAALTSGRDGSSSSGADFIPKKCVRNAYEYLLQDPDDADRFVEPFQTSGIGRTMAQVAAGAAAGVENAATATTSTTASPYGMHVDLCAAVYVNRIILTGKQAAMLLDPNPPTAKPSSGTGFVASGPARAAPKPKKATPKLAPSQLPSIPQQPQNRPQSTHQRANEV